MQIRKNYEQYFQIRYKMLHIPKKSCTFAQ